MPVTLFSNIDFEDANKLIELLENAGARVGIVESERNTFGPQISALDYEDIKKRSKSQIEVEQIKDGTLNKICVMEIISSILSIVACAILLFFPLFFRNQSIEVDGESVITKKYYSVFNITYITISSLISGNYSFTNWFLFDFLRIFVAALILIQAYNAIKITFSVVSEYVNIRKNTTENKNTDLIEVQAILRQNGWWQIVWEGAFLFIFGGYDGVVTSTLIVTATIIVIGFILDKIAKFSKNKLKKK